MRHHLRRVAAFAAAVVAAAGLLSVATPAHADSLGALVYLRNSATRQCLATDWSNQVYTWPGCDGPQRWQYLPLDAYPGTVMFQNQATGRCLMQLDYFRMISAPCDGSRAEFRWRDQGHIFSANTGYQLVGDHNGRVNLHPPFAPNQVWDWA